MVNYTSKESGKPEGRRKAVESLIGILPHSVGFSYVVEEASADFPPADDGANWYLLVNGKIPEIGHMRLIWVDKHRRIRTESMDVGSTTEWLEQSYDEKDAIEAMKFNYANLDVSEEILSKNFPLAADRLIAFRRIAQQTSARDKTDLRLVCAGSEGGATFFLGATIDLKGLAESQKARVVKRNLESLRKAWDEILEYERNWLKREGFV